MKVAAQSLYASRESQTAAEVGVMRKTVLIALFAVLVTGLLGWASTELFGTANGTGNVAIGLGLAVSNTELYGSLGINGTASFTEAIYFSTDQDQWIADKDFHAEGDFWIWDSVYTSDTAESGNLELDTWHHLAGSGSVDYSVDGFLSAGRGGWNSWVGGSTTGYVGFWADLDAHGTNAPAEHFVGNVWGGNSTSLPWPGWFRGDLQCWVSVGDSPSYTGTGGVDIWNEDFAIWDTVLLAPERGSW
jgi:hypothetical protein